VLAAVAWQWRQQRDGCVGSAVTAYAGAVRQQRGSGIGGGGGGSGSRQQGGRAVVAVRQRGDSSSSATAAWRWQAARQRRLQHGVSGGSAVGALAERWWQRRSIRATAASAVAALAMQGFLNCYNRN
jgi:hypothetical protein